MLSLNQNHQQNQNNQQRKRNDYLTYKEYLDFGFDEISRHFKAFPQYLKRASYVIDHVTRNFYKKNCLETDEWEFRKENFKKAVACQIEYFSELEGFTSESLNNEPQQQQIGRISVAKVARINATGQIDERTLLSKDAYIFLEETGLLSRGIG